VTGPLADFLARVTALDVAAAVMVGRLLALAATAVVLLIVYRVAIALIARLLRARGADPRARTLASLLNNLARWSLSFVAAVIVLRELGVDIMAVLVSAGVLGLAIGFGAQTLIRDIITGFFLLFEGLVHVGDLVEIGGRTGAIESIGLRVTTVRMEDGGLQIVPNGQLTQFANYSAGWVRATVDVPVARDVPVERALATLAEVGAAWARETGAALDRPQAQGIMGFSGGDTMLQLAVRVAPERRQAAERELRQRIKEAFDRQHWSPIGAAQG
jgi:small conductance mechanosensitive channel